MSERILVAVAWPYANYLLHVGQVAGAYLPADIFARYQRLIGNEVLMISGSDCHGTPITVTADRENVSPKDIVDRYHPKILEAWEKLGISFDLFTSTLTENHYETMSLEDICNLPVQQIADKNCYLFLWATSPTLKEALQVMESWGFTYKI